MNPFRAFMLAWLRWYYMGEIEEVKQQRVYLIDQTLKAQSYLDNRETIARDKLLQLNRGERNALHQS